MRLIDADAIPYVKTMYSVGLLDMVTRFTIDTMPTIDAVPVKHGKWMKAGQSFVNPNQFRNYWCSVCGYDIEKRKYNYCPKCGARMAEGGER